MLEESHSYKTGAVVRSTKGRDAGRLFLIVGELDDPYVLIADGDLRRLGKPKKKKIKHLAQTGVTLELIKEKLENQKKVFDAELRSALKKFKESLKEE